MSDRDPAFQWETEALRAGGRRRSEPRKTRSSASAVEPGWVTMRQAEAATGIPLGTLRRWSRQGSLPSQSQQTPEGGRRLVWLDAVLERAATLGRQVAHEAASPVPSERSAPPPPPPRRATSMADSPIMEVPGQQRLIEVATPDANDEADPAEPTVDEEHDSLATTGEAATGAVVPDEPAAPPPPPGTMLVPVDAWDKMLQQLGNLHEAGQQLAEARERAAKAETEASFLKERLREMRGATNKAPGSEVVERSVRRRWFRRR